MLINDNGNISMSLRQEYINLLENLLNGEYCSHSFRNGNILSNTLGFSAIYNFRQSFLGRANEEIAQLSVRANTLVSNAISDHMTSVKGCLADPFICSSVHPFIRSSVHPFICAIYGHAHQDEIAGLGYNNNMDSLIIDLDNVWTFTNEEYLYLGAAFGYVHGKTNFLISPILGGLSGMMLIHWNYSMSTNHLTKNV
jgi:hypothetical protein